MPPTFFYAMCLAAYLAAMAVGLVLSAVLFLVPSTRRLALRLCLAIIGSLPGILLFQFVIGVPLAVLLGIVLAFDAVFNPPDVVQWFVGLPTILVMFVSVTAASFAGCYTGGSVGWEIGGGTPLRVALSQQKVPRWILSRVRRRKV
jgi:hypothetical protein